MRKILLATLFLFILFNKTSAQAPSNDNPCNATPLTVGSSCSYTPSTNLNATATAGVPAPGCANYQGGDVWFSAVVPASGSIIFDSNSGVITDGGMALYTGTCNSLTLVSCDDDGSANALMSSISATGLTPGTTVYIRFWEYGNDNNGTFSICARSFSCNSVNNASCTNADPFCTGVSYDYCNTTNVPSLGGGGAYGCCLTTPNPAFYYLNVSSSGQIVFNISQQTNTGVPIDVDFVLWGPFASQSAMCAGYSASNIVDCSYSIAAIETATIPAAVAGQWYLILITNFANQAGVINFSQTNTSQSGAGTTNCNILSAIPGACSNGLYTLTGSVQVPSPPGTGTLTISTSCGGSQVINAPFTTNIPYSIPGICGNGLSCNVTAVFSAAGAPTILPGSYTAPSCNTLTATPSACVNGQYVLSGTLVTGCLPATGTLTIANSCGGSQVFNAPFSSPLNWSLPASNGNGGTCTVTAVYSAAGAPVITPFTFTEPTCCPVNAGTIGVTQTNGTQTTLANGNIQVVLCPNGSYGFTSNNNFTLPPAGCPNCVPELMYAIYVSPGPTVPDPDLDPNWTGYYWTGQDFTTANGAGYNVNSGGSCSPLLSLNPVAGYASPNATNNTLVFVPITADDGDNDNSFSLNHDQNNDGCFDLGNQISVTFLNPIKCNTTQTCNGSVSVEINGGYPQFFPGNYSLTNTGSGTLSSSTVASGGNVTISGLLPGQTYSFSVNDGNGCTTTYSGTYVGPPVLAVTPAASTVCLGACVNLASTITPPTASYTFSSTNCSKIPDAGVGAANNPPSSGGTWASNSINVAGVCDPSWQTGEPLTICLNINHTFIADLNIYIQAPNGQYYLLANDVGGGGVNFSGTCFSAIAAQNITAGAPPFSGSYQPQGTGSNFSGLNGTATNGTWTIWVSDDVAVDVGTLMSWSITFGGQSTYTYAWTPTAGLSSTNTATTTACPTTTTTYTLTVTNSCGCTTTASTTITVNPPVTPTFNPIGPICSGSSVSALPTTSTNGISGVWSPSTISNTTSGTYTFTPNAGQCANPTSINVSVLVPPILSAAITNPLCFGVSNGSISINVVGGTTPYQYAWSGSSSTTSTASNLSAGTYNVTVTTASGCTATLSNTVTQPTALTASATTTTAACSQPNGSASINGTGGTPGYTYSFNGGAAQPSGSFIGIAGGNYNAVITDANGCTVAVPVVINNQPSPTITSSNASPVTCNGGSNGTATITVSGGTAPLQYSINGSAQQNSNVFSGLTAGSYAVIVTDANGCTASTNVTVTSPNPITVNASTINATCSASNGSINLIASGGTASYTYTISGGATNTTGAFGSLGAGSYNVTVTDASGCTIMVPVAIGNQQAPSITSSSTQPVSCYGGGNGSMSVTASGGTGSIIYTLNGSLAQTSGAYTGLFAGNYTVTATDANGCSAVIIVSISQPTVLTASSSSGSIACYGGTTSVLVTSSGGVSPYTGTGTLTVGAGSYTYTISDANGCTVATSITIIEPSQLNPSSTSSPAACNGSSTGSIVVAANGGTAPYAGTGTFSGLSAGSYSYTVTDANGCTAVTNNTVTQPTLLTSTATPSPALCNGAATGSVVVNGAGGTAPYSGTGTFSNLSAGSYSYTITDANGCTSVVSATVTQPTQLTTASTSGAIACFGGTTSLSVTGGGGTAPYSGTGSFTVGAGSYSYTVTDANGCTVVTSITVAQPTLLTSTATPSPALCNGAATGSVIVTGAGGTAPYTGTGTFSNLAAGSNSYTVTDANGCTSVVSATVTQPTLLTAASTSGSIACFGGTTSVSVSGGGGTAPYSGTGSFTVGAGSYSYTVTDANGCTAVTSITVAQPTLLTSTATPSPALCNGAATGSVIVTGAGGTAPYTGTGTFSNLAAGSYSYTVTDANGCTSVVSATVTQPTLLTAASTSGSIACFGGTTSVSVSGGGGTAPYSGTGSFTVGAGAYSYTVTDANGCTVVTSIIVAQPTLLTSTATPSPALCNGAATGSVVVNGAGGTAPYSGTGTFSNLAAGPYSYTVTDANGCTSVVSATVTEPTLLTASSTSGAIACFGGTTSVSVIGGGGTAPYSGTGSFTVGAGSYSYTVTDANGCTMVTSITVAQPTLLTSTTTPSPALCNGAATGSVIVNGAGGTAPYFGTGTFSNLAAGSYSYTVTDANGCTSVVSATVTEPTLLTATSTSGAIACFGGTTSVNVTGGGGTATYSGTGSFTVGAGSYSYTVTDANGCTVATSITVTQPTLLTSTATPSPALCNGAATGSVVVTGAGGTAPYSGTGTFINLSAGSYSYTVTDANGCTSVVSATVTQPTPLTAASTSGSIACFGGTTSVSVSGGGGTASYSGTGSFTVGAGSYSYTVTDANGCTMVTSITVAQPSLLTSTATPSPALCNGAATGSVVVTGAGGTAPYTGTGTFSNLAAGSYLYTITDANGCTSVVSATVTEPTLLTAASTSGAIACFGGTTSVNVTGGGGTAPYSGTGSLTVGAGSYSYTVTDANGCTVVTSITVAQPSLLTTTATPSPALCNGAATGSVVVNGAGGTAPYSGTGTFSNLAAGSYSYTVTDANGCTSLVSATVTQPTLLTAASSSGAIACFGGTTSVSVIGGGGTAPYSGTGSFTVGAGSYSYTVTDANGCTMTTSITVAQPSQLTAASTTTPASCGNSNGSASISASGGTSAYSYSINGGPSQLTSNFPNLLAGNYTVVVTDANGCTTSVSASVSNTSAPIINTVASSNNSCYNSNNGTISINANGGTGALQYSINNGGTYQAGNNFTNLAAGTYNIVVTDNLGCQATSSITITQPSALSAATTNGTIACNGGTTTINVAGTGGTLPYTGTGTYTVTAGNYSYTISDANGCTVITTISVTQPTAITSSSSASPVSCFGGSNGSINIFANGGTSPYSGAGTVTALTAGTYSYTVTDANGCTSSTTATVSQPTHLTAISTSTPSSCGSNNGTTSILATGGIPVYTYSINNGATSQASGNFSNLLAGTYPILITDANGCTLVINSTINNTSSPAVNSINTTNNTCFNSNNGTLSIAASGGTGVLQYSLTGGSPFQPTGNFNNLAAGTYNILVVDALGCQTTSTATVTQPAVLIASVSPGTIACFGGSTSVIVSAIGGTTPYVGAGTLTVTAGTYSYTITDANGCTNTTSVTISQPTQLISSVTSTTVSCNGGSNGSATISANGGTLPYAGVGVYSNLIAGTYNYTVTDANGCNSTISTTIMEPSALSATISTVPSTCGNPDGSMNVSASGGTSPYTYNATGTYQPSNQFNNLPSGTYNVTVMDVNGCTFTTSTTITNQASPTIATVSSTNASCFGLNNGSVSISASGGTGAIQYSINNGTTFQGTNIFNNLTPATYQVVVSDANGCIAITSFNITQPSALSSTLNITGTTCSASNGAIIVNANGGTPSYQYSFNNGASFQPTATYSGIVSGSYNIVVSDANGCTSTALALVSNAPGPIVSNTSTSNITCFGLNNGTANITITSGTAPMNYVLNGGSVQTSGAYNNLASGSYNIQVTDANGCTTSTSFNITQPSSITASFNSTNSTCGNSDGSLTINAAGGTGTFNYSINNGTTSQSSPVFNLMPSGSYNILITDANGCTQTISATINNSAAPVIQSNNSSNITCNGLANGSISVVSTGGTGVLSYSLNGGINQTNGIFNGLGPGTYTIVVSDNNGCTVSSLATIIQPAPLTANSANTISTCGNSNGSINITAQGGTNPYSYSLNGSPLQPTNIFSGLSQGNYGIVISDANGCTSTLQTLVAGAPGPIINQGVATNITCNGLSNGTIQIVSTGGSAPIQYSINGGTSFSPNSNFPNLSPGTYNLLVTDANGCTSISSASISQPTALSIIPSTTNSTCGQSDGTISIVASGGTSPYSYSINNGATYQPIATFNSLPAGGYNLIVTDGNGCTTSSIATINNDAAPAVVSSTSTNVSCFGLSNGTITVNANGGTGSLLYSINGGMSQLNGAYSNLGPGIFNIVITDANGCTANSQLTITEPPALTAVNTSNPSTCGNANGSISVNTAGGVAPYTFQANGVSNGSSNIISNLSQGAYSIIVTDQNGCTASISTNLINLPGPVISTVAPINVTCNGLNNGSINIISTGGTSPISYSINNGSSNSSSPTFNNLAPGNYNILVTDANGCTSVSSSQIIQPVALSLSSNSTSATCGQNNGSFTLAANGGTPPYQYSGNGGTTFQPNGNFLAIGPGTYSVILTDLLGCTTNGSVSVSNSAAPVISSVPTSNISCNGYNDGSATINVNGGAAPISYSINGGFTTTTNNTFNNLAPGPYNILVSDANGCTGTYSINITQPTAISLSSTTSNASCGNNDGTATVTGIGGSGNLSYSINGGPLQPNGSFNNLGAGNYTVIATDQYGCTASLVASVSNNAAPIISNVIGTDVNCFGNANGTINIAAAGGTAPLNFSINNGVTYQSAPSFTSLPGGVYSISVLDANGCIASSNINIAEPQQLSLSTLPTNSTCGNPNGNISSLASGGSSPYTYSINNGSTFQGTGSFGNLFAGSYSILATDNNGCTSQSSSTVLNAGGPSILANTVNDVTCFGLSNGSITSTISGGTAPIYYSINGAPNQASNFFGSLAPGSYNIVVSDANGCTATSNSNIFSPSQLVLNPISTGSTCSNSNGSISISVTGGVSTYSYSNNGGLTYQNPSSFNNLSAGTYNLMVMDANGCTTNGTIAVADAPGPLMGTPTAVNINCYNGSNGSISAAIIGGTSPFSYSMNQGTPQPTGLFNNLSAGSYNILVTDANGCTATASQILSQPSALLTSTTSTPSTCFNGTNGAASVIVSGGTTPYNYQWSSGGSTSASASNLMVGTYSVTVTDNNGCTSILSATVSNIAGPAITNTLTINNSCYQSNNGSVSVTINGGTGPFTYLLGGSISQSIGTFSNLNAGTDTILVTDNNGCEALTSFTINEPTQLLLAGTFSDATCGNSNGTINLASSGGTPPYSYSYNGGTSYQPASSFINLAAGNYGTAVMDANGCTTSSSVIIVDLVGPVITSATPSNPLCFGSSNGSITISASGGSTLTYSINNGVSNQGNSVFNGLGAGSYSILVADTNGCLAFGNATLIEPDPLIGVAATNPSICNNGTNGSASISVQGGISPYSYSWSNGSSSNSIGNLTAGTYTISVTDANGCTMLQNALVSNIAGPTIVNSITTNNTCYQSNDGTATVQISSGTGPFNFNLNGTINQSNGVFVNLAAGNGNVLVTDNNGCTATASFLITEPNALSVVASNTSTTCGNSNGALNLIGSGGTFPYTYSNNGGTTYQSQTSFNGLTAGTYNLSIMDANGCLSSGVESIADLAGPNVASVINTNPLCFGSTNGSLTITASGNGQLNYSINNGSSTQTTTLFQNLGAGFYTVLVTDTNGCTTTASASLIDPSLLTANASTMPSVCDGGTNGSASILAQGGTAPYTYLWNNGSSMASANNIAAGTYTVTITDANGCSLSQSAAVSNIPSPQISSISTTNNTCYQQGDGTANIIATSGTAPYLYDAGLGALSNIGSFTSIAAGTYNITVTDANGCTTDSIFNISEPLPITIASSVNGSICSGNNGTISIVANGGTTPYQYSSNNGVAYQPSNAFTNLSAGIYPISIMDSNGCVLSQNISVIDAPGPIVLSVSTNNVTCNGYTDGFIAIATTSGTAPLNYQINNGANQLGSQFISLPAGAYNILVTDANGCTTTTSASITEPQPITINASGQTTICLGQSATISAIATGGNGGYVYTWSNGLTGDSQSVSPPTSSYFTVLVTDSLGCPGVSATIAINVNPPLQLVITPNDTICEGQSSTIIALASGGDGGPYNYYWSGMTSAAPSQTVSPLVTTSYTVSVTDGCTTPFASAISQVNVNPLPVVDFSLNPHQGCAPLTVSFINNSNAGGNPQYYWDFGDNSNSTSGTPTHTYTEPGTYGVTLKAISAAGCSRQISFPDTIHVWPVPIANILATPPVASILYPVIQFRDGGVGADSWLWDFGDDSSLGNGQTTQHSYELPNIYDVTLYVENQYGCKDTAYTRVTIEEETTLYVPNAFSPNGDGVNDMFNIYGIGITSGTMNIFNRWGQMIYSTDKPQIGWNGIDERSGELCQIGVYVYRIDVITYTGLKRTISGRVTLVM